MADPEAWLGGRLPLLDPDTLTHAQTTAWDRMDATMGRWAAEVGFRSKTRQGRFIGPFNPTLRSPDIGLSFLQLQADEARHTSLSERVRQIVILSVGAAWKAPYEPYAHAAAARKAGFSRQVIAALVAGRSLATSSRPMRTSPGVSRWRSPSTVRSGTRSTPKGCNGSARRGSSIWSSLPVATTRSAAC